MKSLKIRTKLISLFVVIKVIPLIIISYLAYEGIRYLAEIFNQESKTTLEKSYEVVENTANIAVANSIKALDKKSQEALEVLTNNVALDVSSFLYARDKELLFLSKIDNLNEKIIKDFYETNTKDVIVPQEFLYDEQKKWITTDKSQSISRTLKSSLEHNRKYFNHIAPKKFKTKHLRLYKEISVIDLYGNETIKISSIDKKLKNISGILIPGGFGKRGTDGKIEAIKHARLNKIPFLGICYGMQMAIIEFARNQLNLKNATSSEFDKKGLPIIGLINEYTRNRNIPIGKIDIMGKFSFFEVPTDFETDIMSGLIDANWNGNRVNVEVSQAPGTKSRRGGEKRRPRSGGSYSGRGDRKRSSGGRNGRISNSRGSSSSRDGGSSSRRSSGGESSGGGSSFKGKFNAAAKRKRRD